MSIERKPGRYAHNVGHTDVCYTLDGAKIITCGTDGDIRIWADFDDVDPIQTCVGEWALCVREKEKHVYIATDNNDVQIVTLADAERDGILVRFTAPATHIAVGKNHNMIAVVSEDMDVKVIDVTESGNCFSFTGLAGPPLSVALSFNAKMLAVSSGDGFLRVWRVDTQELLKEIHGLPKCNSFANAKLLSRMDFHPTSDSHFAYPSDNSVVILNTTDWSEAFTLKSSSINAPISIVQYSPCGKFLAAAAQDGAIAIWRLATQTLVDVSEHPSCAAVCAMAWNPTGNGDIAYCDVQGELGVINVTVSDAGGAVQKDEVGQMNQVVVQEESMDIELPRHFQESDDDDDDDDEDNENVISLEKLKRETLGVEENESEVRSVSRSPTPRPKTPVTPMQPPFMPSATPEHLNPRYLCWNEVGVVRSYGNPDEGDSGEQCSIEVEFHDATFHNSMMMQNYQGYTMGAVSSSALAVANTSQISVIPLNSSMKEWNLSVPSGEEIISIACSSNLICLATTAYFVRICSVFGIQKAIFSVPGPIVAMSAHNNNLLVAYHVAPPKNKDQSIDLFLITVDGMAFSKKQIGCALRPETTLFWLGFSDVGTPAMYDSFGLLSLYPQQRNVWIPFCDTTKNTSPADGFFPTAVDEKLQSMRGIRCKGAIYPAFIPRPVLSELALQPVFAELTTERAQLEANLFTWSTLQTENVERKYKETALKTFALACKSNLDERAIELLAMLQDQQLLNLCVKYAAKQNRRLAEKLMEIAPFSTNNSENETQSVQSVKKPINRRFVSNSIAKFQSKKRLITATESVEVTENNEESPAVTTETTINNSDTSIQVNTQESLFSEELPVNPFVKKAKTDDSKNPLNLTDKYAGYEELQKKEKENKLNEKRKLNDSDSEKQKGKQRKLDKFMFSKTS